VVAGSIPVALAGVIAVEEAFDEIDDDQPFVIVPDDQSLNLVREAKFYGDKQFVLELTDGDGRSFEVHLDGIQVGDIITDAIEAGLPVSWKSL